MYVVMLLYTVFGADHESFRHAELLVERIVFGQSSILITHFFNECNALPVTDFIVIVCLIKLNTGKTLH